MVVEKIGGAMGISDDIRLKKKTGSAHSDNRSNDDFFSETKNDPHEVKIRFNADDSQGEEPAVDNDYYGPNYVENDFFQPDPNYHPQKITDDKVDDQLNEHQNDESQPVLVPEKRSNPMTKWVVLLILVLIGLLVWQNFSKIEKLIGWPKKSSSSDTSLPKYDSETTGNDYTSQNAANSSADSTNQSQNAATTPATPSIDKSQITIEVLNGNGISGSASSVRDTLVAAGFNVDRVANAYSFSYQTSQIYYKTGKNAEADLVKSTLSSRQCDLLNDDSVVGNYDIVVVVGQT